MNEPIWNKFLTDRDRLVFEQSGFATRIGFGKRPALIVIDVSIGFCGKVREPILESIKKWRFSCGEDAYDALSYIKRLRDTAHGKGIPVIYTTGCYRSDNWEIGIMGLKNSRSDEDVAGQASKPTADGNQIHPEIAPGPRDLVCYKQKPSAFFGTNLAAYLVLLGCDSLIVTGTTTSGCVRATAVDAASMNYRVAVVREACFDRSEASHAISLCDINAKYGDVVEAAEATAFLEGLQANLFELPAGQFET